MFREYTASTGFNNWYPYRFSLDYAKPWAKTLEEFREAERWCFDQFGTDPERWYCDLGHLFGFRDAGDATAFKLRWC